MFRILKLWFTKLARKSRNTETSSSSSISSEHATFWAVVKLLQHPDTAGLITFDDDGKPCSWVYVSLDGPISVFDFYKNRGWVYKDYMWHDRHGHVAHRYYAGIRRVEQDRIYRNTVADGVDLLYFKD